MSDLVKQLWLAGRGTIQVLAAVRIEELEKECNSWSKTADNYLDEVILMKAKIGELEDQCKEYLSQLSDIRKAALPDPCDEREISVEWLRALINRNTPPPC